MWCIIYFSSIYILIISHFGTFVYSLNMTLLSCYGIYKFLDIVISYFLLITSWLWITRHTTNVEMNNRSQFINFPYTLSFILSSSIIHRLEVYLLYRKRHFIFCTINVSFVLLAIIILRSDKNIDVIHKAMLHIAIFRHSFSLDNDFVLGVWKNC